MITILNQEAINNIAKINSVIEKAEFKLLPVTLPVKNMDQAYDLMNVAYEYQRYVLMIFKEVGIPLTMGSRFCFYNPDPIFLLGYAQIINRMDIFITGVPETPKFFNYQPKTLDETIMFYKALLQNRYILYFNITNKIPINKDYFTVDPNQKTENVTVIKSYYELKKLALMSNVPMITIYFKEYQNLGIMGSLNLYGLNKPTEELPNKENEQLVLTEHTYCVNKVKKPERVNRFYEDQKQPLVNNNIRTDFTLRNKYEVSERPKICATPIQNYATINMGYQVVNNNIIDFKKLVPRDEKTRDFSDSKKFTRICRKNTTILTDTMMEDDIPAEQEDVMADVQTLKTSTRCFSSFRDNKFRFGEGENNMRNADVVNSIDTLNGLLNIGNK